MTDVDSIPLDLGVDDHVPGTLVQCHNDRDDLSLALYNTAIGRPAVVLIAQADTALGVVTDFLFGKYSRTFQEIDFVRTEFDSVREMAASWNAFSAPSFVFIKDGEHLATLTGSHPAELEMALQVLNNDPNVDVKGFLADSGVKMETDGGSVPSYLPPMPEYTAPVIEETVENPVHSQEVAVNRMQKQLEETIRAISNVAGWFAAQKVLEWWFPESKQ